MFSILYKIYKILYSQNVLKFILCSAIFAWYPSKLFEKSKTNISCHVRHNAAFAVTAAMRQKLCFGMLFKS